MPIFGRGRRDPGAYLSFSLRPDRRPDEVALGEEEDQQYRRDVQGSGRGLHRRGPVPKHVNVRAPYAKSPTVQRHPSIRPRLCSRPRLQRWLAARHCPSARSERDQHRSPLRHEVRSTSFSKQSWNGPTGRQPATRTSISNAACAQHGVAHATLSRVRANLERSELLRLFAILAADRDRDPHLVSRLLIGTWDGNQLQWLTYPSTDMNSTMLPSSTGRSRKPLLVERADGDLGRACG